MSNAQHSLNAEGKILNLMNAERLDDLLNLNGGDLHKDLTNLRDTLLKLASDGLELTLLDDGRSLLTHLKDLLDGSQLTDSQELLLTNLLDRDLNALLSLEDAVLQLRPLLMSLGLVSPAQELTLAEIVSGLGQLDGLVELLNLNPDQLRNDLAKLHDTLLKLAADGLDLSLLDNERPLLTLLKGLLNGSELTDTQNLLLTDLFNRDLNALLRFEDAILRLRPLLASLNLTYLAEEFSGTASSSSL